MNDAFEQIAKVLGVQKKEEISTAEILEILCQIALALLIIFMMINVLFVAGTKEELAVIKAWASFWKNEYDKITSTPTGQEHEKRVEALINLQKQKLLLALETIEKKERDNFGITTFAPRNADGETEYLMDDLLFQGKVVNQRFKRASTLAKEALSNRQKMQEKWLKTIQATKGLKLSYSPVVESIVEHPEIMTPDNAEWLVQEIRTKTEAIYVDCCDMQRKALAHLIKYYQEHTDVLMGTKFGKQLEKQLDNMLEAPTEDRSRLASELSREFYRYVKLLFEEQEVPLLQGV